MSQFPMQDDWENLLRTSALIRHYHLFNMALPGSGRRFEFLDQNLATMLYINAVSLLDQGLQIYVDVNQITCPRNQYQATLGGRLNCLNDRGDLANHGDLWKIRERRNEFGHEDNVMTDWKELDTALGVIGSELHHLGLVSSLPVYEFVFERGALKQTGREGYWMERECWVGLNYQSGNPALRHSWTEYLAHV